MKKYVAALLALIMLLSLTAGCGKGTDVTGMYLCVGESYDNTPLGEPSAECWVELKRGGKGTYFSGMACDLVWELDGETFTGTVTFGALEDTLTGTLRDGVLDVTMSGKTMRLVKEGAEVPTGGGESDAASGLAGYYAVSGAIVAGIEMNRTELEAFGLADGAYLQLNADGTGTLAVAGEDAGSITYDEKTGTLTAEDGTTMSFTVDGDTITVVFAGIDGTTMRYTRQAGAAVPGTDGAAVPGTFDFDTVTVAGSVAEAFSGAVPGGDGFVSATTSLELGSNWYGILECTDFVGVDTADYTKDIVAIFDTTSQGYEFFEIYAGTEVNVDNLIVSMYILLYEDYFLADIQEEDAWVFERYLEPDEEQYFSPTLENGALEMWYDFVAPDGRYSCSMHFFLRENGAQWDEANDPLPPSYDAYKASLVS